MKAFFDTIETMEMEQMKYIGLDEEDADLYLSQIRYDKKQRYYPNLIVKVSFRSNSYDVDIRNKSNTSISLTVSQLFNFSKVKCDIYIDNIWKYNGKFVCKWKVDKILIL